MSESNAPIKLFTDNGEPEPTPSLAGDDLDQFVRCFIKGCVTRFQNLSTPEEIEEFFEVNRTAKWIKDNGFKRVALQLADYYLKFAFTVATTVERQSGAKTYVLADTSYKNCCVDFVAAEHSKCDALVHYGEACLSSVSEKIPVQYVFGKFPIDFTDFKAKFATALKDFNGNLILVYDSVYAHLNDQMVRSLETIGEGVHVLPCTTKRSTDSESASYQLGRRIPDEMKSADDSTNNKLIFIGQEDSALLPIWLMTFPKFETVTLYNPKSGDLTSESTAAQRRLRKRLFLIEKLRDANIVGLVVGTLGTQGFPEAIQRIRALCKAAQKKLYVFSIGKLNEAKLSNFAGDIDAFIFLSCPLGVILDSSDFFKPIVSLFEAEIALNSAASEWYASAGWTSEFQRFLNDPIRCADGDHVDVSLISGRVRATKIDDEQEPGSTNQNRQLTAYSAGDYFANRTWKGLDDTNYEADTGLKKGLKGIAMGYATEKEGSKEP